MIIAFTCLVKYLGACLDPALNWKQHITEKKNKFYCSIWMCRKAMGKTWGISPKIALWMYKTVLLPQILYSSVV